MKRKFEELLEQIERIPILKTITVLIICLLLSVVGYELYKEHTRLPEIPYDLSVRYQENILHTQQAKFNLVNEVEYYIQKIAPTSCLNALTLVEACDEYDFDLIFALAQGQLESHFGTRGIAAKTNSVFNVHSFDGLSADQIKKSGKGYSHPDHSVRPYLNLMSRRYLVDGKTEKDMFNNFVDVDGKRYASAENYEQMLMNTYLKIQSETKIDSLIMEYQKFKIITEQ